MKLPESSTQDTTAVMSEIQRIQGVITDLISLFQDYRTSIDDELGRLTADISNIDSYIEKIVDSRVSKLREELVSEVNENIMNSFHRLDEVGFFDEVTRKTIQNDPKLSSQHKCQVTNSEMDALRDELALLKDAELQIIAKINAISAANTHCHERSSEAIKSIRDALVNNNQLINR
jgi:hypothetical protein